MIKCIKCFGQVATNMTNDINIRRLLCNNQPNAALFTFCVCSFFVFHNVTNRKIDRPLRAN